MVKKSTTVKILITRWLNKHIQYRKKIYNPCWLSIYNYHRMTSLSIFQLLDEPKELEKIYK